VPATLVEAILTRSRTRVRFPPSPLTPKLRFGKRKLDIRRGESNQSDVPSVGYYRLEAGFCRGYGKVAPPARNVLYGKETVAVRIPYGLQQEGPVEVGSAEPWPDRDVAVRLGAIPARIARILRMTL
jgi:hypothetical protein